MNAEQFAYWLRGYCEANGAQIPTHEQWDQMVGKLYEATRSDPSQGESKESPYSYVNSDGSLKSSRSASSSSSWIHATNSAAIAGFAAI